LNLKDTGTISWNDFCTHMLQFYQEEDYENTLRTSPFNSEPRIRHIPHNKVDTYEQNSDGLFRFVCFF